MTTTPEIIDWEEAAKRLEMIDSETVKEARIWLEESFENNEVHWYEGDTQLALLDNSDEYTTIIINGNLTLHKHLFSWGPLIVLGDLEASHWWQRSYALVEGKVSLQGILFANSLNDYSLGIGNGVTAKVLMEHGMSTGIVGEVQVEYALSWMNQIVSNTTPLAIRGREAVAEIFVDEVIEDKEKGVLNEDYILSVIEEEKPLFK